MEKKKEFNINSYNRNKLYAFYAVSGSKNLV